MHETNGMTLDTAEEYIGEPCVNENCREELDEFISKERLREEKSASTAGHVSSLMTLEEAEECMGQPLHTESSKKIKSKEHRRKKKECRQEEEAVSERIYRNIAAIKSLEEAIEAEEDGHKKSILIQRFEALKRLENIGDYIESDFYKVDDPSDAIKKNSSSPVIYNKRPADLEAVINYKFLNPNARYVLGHIINKCEEKLSWIRKTNMNRDYKGLITSHSEIAAETGLSENNIYRSLEELEKKKIISKSEYTDSRGRRTKILFNPNWNEWDAPVKAKELGFKKLSKRQEMISKKE